MIVAVGVVLVGGIVWWASRPAPAPTTERVPASAREEDQAERYAGYRTCRECHPGAYALYTESGHARTIRPAASRALARWLDGKEFADPEDPDVTWSYDLDDGVLSTVRTEGAEHQRLMIDFALGSGNHATTFVSVDDSDTRAPVGREHRLTYFAHEDGMGLTPGQRAETGNVGTNRLGRDLSSQMVFLCIGCHVTLTSAHGAEELDVETMIPNVSCERCHGPAREHVEKARRGQTNLTMPFGLGRWTAESQIRMCGRCHRLPEMAPAEAIRPDNTELARFQPIGLLQSPCYKRSDGALSCVTCHDPHARTSTDRVHYEATCRSCHSDAPEHSRTVCPVSPRSGCIDCHMPSQEATAGMSFTDHWIRVREERGGHHEPSGAEKGGEPASPSG